jgi:hypothetical protein
MIVEGYEVPRSIEDAAVAEIRRRSGFSASEIIAFLHRAGVPPRPVLAAHGEWGPAHRIADRILQRERRAGRIEFRRGLWHRATSP